MADVQPVHMARRDEHGLLPLCCSTAYLDGHIAGHFLGYRQGAESVAVAIEADVAEVVRGAIKSINVKIARAKADSQ